MYNEDGCPLHSDPTRNDWRHNPGEWITDVWGMENKGTGVDAAKCQLRSNDLNKNCGTTTFRTWFVPSENGISYGSGSGSAAGCDFSSTVGSGSGSG